MSGLLRRIKRSRAADAGEAPAEGQAAGPDGAPTTAEIPGGDPSSVNAGEMPGGDPSSTNAGEIPGGDPSSAKTAVIPGADPSSAKTSELPAGDATSSSAVAAGDEAASPGGRRGRLRGRLRRSRKAIELPAAGPVRPATAPAIQADPHTPAGLDPAEAGWAPPSGRRGRLRKRLRYLRRARELMLRDLGGLFYEVHRTGGGDVAAHANVIGPKVERLARLDAEARAIETALGAPRAATVVFEPGIGGTCESCGELYGSADRFCSHCGAPTGSAARPTAAPPAEPRPVPAMPKPPRPADEAAAGAPSAGVESPTPTSDPAPAAQQPAADASAGESDDRAEAATTADDPDPPPAADEPATGEQSADERRNPSSGQSNGRADERTAPDLSSGDPLSARDSRS